jgi:mannose-1-phosphate guanylyltransferase/mannose-1-phosphate guanylyltransferase/mannose-6-phosphate isomerase
MDFDDRIFPAPDAPELAGGASSSQIPSPCRGLAGSSMIVPVVLSGGSGSRLWPYSTEETPKQFLSFMGAKSLFHMTLERIADRSLFSDPIVVGSLRHAELCGRDLVATGTRAHLILEPCSRNTAAAIAMAAEAACERDGEDSLLLIMPSDHMIADVAAFHDAIAIGAGAAGAGHLVTFGIHPTAPETGFGYIQAGASVPGIDGVSHVTRFVEKPELKVAEQMVADGSHFWNAGIFLFRAGTFLEEVARHAPDIAASAAAAVQYGQRCENHLIPDLQSLEECPNQSVDYAVMEHSERVAVVPMSPGWSDLGSWDALAEVLDTRTHGPITALDCNDCFIRSDGVQVAALGIRDLIIVASGQRLLILPRGRSQELKKLLTAMESIAA